MVKWTPEQQRAIDEKGNNILVAAAAGSGKTAVLVERIIEKVLDETDPINIDELLVATFTNAAAEEMSQRIGQALEKALKNDPTSYHLKKQLSLLQRASISTIHSFCLNVVRQYSYILDLDPAFRIGDEMEIDLLKHEVLEELFEERYGEDGEELESFFAVVDMFSNDRSDAAVEKLILRLHTFAKQNPWPEKWLHNITTIYDVDEHTPESELFWVSVLKEELQEEFLSLRKMIERGITIANSDNGPEHYEEALKSDLDMINNVLAHIDDWDALQKTVSSIRSLKRLSGKKSDADVAKMDEIKAIREVLRKQLKSLRERWFSRSLTSHLRDMKTLHPIVKELTRIVLQFEERFVAEKRKRVIVDFNDLEHFALQILIEPESDETNVIPSSIATYYENQFKEILVDEYQDINLVQETIIQAISKQTGPGNVFMVGDVKQSIYRFRHAEPTLFIDKYERYIADEQAGIRIDLAKNFRSRETILTGANFIFKQIFDQTLGDINYDEAAELAYGNRSYDHIPLKEDMAELIIINDDSEAKESFLAEADESVEDLSKVQLEGRLYARKINDWLGKNDKPALQVSDKDDEGNDILRRVQYKDIVILLRSLTNAPVIIDELKKQGIPVYSELKKGYLQAIEIQVMLNMLKIIDNPYQDIPLASVLRSPIVSLNEEQLAQIKLMQKGNTFYEALVETSKGEGELSKIVNQFLQDLSTFRALAREESLSELIWTIFQKTGYFDFVGGIPGGRQRQANLRALYDRARSYEETSFRGLFRFLRFIERMEDEDKDLGAARALSEQENVVRIMTIHNSKGLEFPVVILGKANKQFNFRDLNSKYILNKEYGFASKFIDPVKRISYSTLYYLAIREEEKRNMLSEEMRVLYVALTRAKDKLAIVGYVDSFEKTLEKWQAVEEHAGVVLPTQLRKGAQTYLDWIGPSLIRHQQNDELRENKVMVSAVPESIKNDRSKWKIDIIDSVELFEEAALEEVNREDLQLAIQQWKPLKVEATWDDTLTNESHMVAETVSIDERLQFTYEQYKQATTSRAKQSVTEIKRRFEAQDEYSERSIIPSFEQISNKRPLFLQKSKTLTRAEIGTAMHTVMQHIPFDETWTEEKLDEFLIKLIDEEKLTAGEANYIDKVAIEHFFQTDIATLLRENEVQREVPFSYTIDAKQLYKDWDSSLDEKVLIQGVIDCIIFTDEGIVILDYKTDRINDEEITEDVIEELKQRYEVQLTLYKTALENILNTKIKASYLYFFSRKLTIEM